MDIWRETKTDKTSVNWQNNGPGNPHCDAQWGYVQNRRQKVFNRGGFTFFQGDLNVFAGGFERKNSIYL